jgi:hypothetical protein
MMAAKTEHAGAKNGGGYWGKRAEAKNRCKRLRRKEDRKSVLKGATENGVKENASLGERDGLIRTIEYFRSHLGDLLK